MAKFGRRRIGKSITRSGQTGRGRRETRLTLEKLESRLVLSANVTSYHNDNQSTGVNSAETLLTVGNVNAATFGKTFSTPVDGQIYAEPLFVQNVNITVGNFQGVHNVVYVATEHDGLYAIDSVGGNILWNISFLNSSVTGAALPGATSITTPTSSDVNSGDISPEVGITGTPVIDVSQNALFVIAKTKQVVAGNTHFAQSLFKVDIRTGGIIASHLIADYNAATGYSARTLTSASDPNQDPFVFGNGDGSTTINGQSRVYFNALRQMDRPGVELVNGQIYTFWASHGDNGPYHGWILRFDQSTLALTAALNTTPNGGLGGIWQGGDIAPSDFDSSGNPRFFFETGNGTFDGDKNSQGVATGLNAQGFPTRGDYGDSFLRVDTDATTTQANQNINGWGLKVGDYFSPHNNHALDGADRDLGSGGPVVLPDSLGAIETSGARQGLRQQLLIGSGKEGKVYLIDRNNMGKFDGDIVNTSSGGTDHIVQEQTELSGVLNAPVYYNNTVYFIPGYGGQGRAFSIASGSSMFSPAPVSTTPSGFGFGNLVGSPTLSANGATNAILWEADTGTSTLRAYNAANLALLWTSAQAAGNRDTVPGFVLKFSVPTVANGQVFLGSSNSLVAYGPPVVPTSGPLAPSGAAATVPNFQTVKLTWQDNSNNEDYFSVQRSASQTGPFVEVGEASANSTTYTDSNNLASQTTYYYQIVAHNAFGGGAGTFSPPSNVVSITTPQAPPTGTGDGLAASYWNDAGDGTHFVGSPNLITVDPTINVPVSNASPHAGINATNYSAEWTGRIQAQYSETYTFFTESDDGVRLWIKPTASGVWTLVVDNFTNHGPTENSGAFAMSGGQQYDLKLDFFQGTGPWTTQLEWASASTPQVVIAQSQLYSGVAPAIPSGLTVTPASGVSANVNWTDNSNNETGFTLQRTNPDATTTLFTVAAGTTAYNDTGLTPGATYSYQVRANNFAANSAFTAATTVIMPTTPPPPTNGHATAATTNSIALAWQLNSSTVANQETSVLVSRKIAANTFALIATLPAGTTSYTDHGPNGNGLNAGTQYDYHIQAANAAGVSDLTGTLIETLTLAPSGLTAMPGVGLISLSWTAPAIVPADGTYNVYRGISAGGENPTALASGLTNASYTDVTASPGQPYFYFVRAVDTGGASAISNEVNSTAASSNVPNPASASAVVAGTTINLSWSSVPAATSYKVYRSTSPGGEGVTPIASGVTATSFADPNRQAGLSYYYQVTAVNLSGESARSPEAIGVLAPSAPLNPTAVIEAQDRQDVFVDWTPAPGAVSYNIFRGGTPGGEGSTPYVTGVTGGEFIDTGAATVPGASYYYKIVAINAGGQSAASNEAFVATPPAAPATPTAAIQASGNVALNWATATGATSYNVYRATTAGAEGTTPLVIGLSSPHYVDSAIGAGGSFYYVVTGLGLGGESLKSGEASVAFTAGTPHGPGSPAATAIAYNRINLSWTAPSGSVTGYNIFRGTTSGGEAATPINGSPIAATTYSDIGLADNVTYYYTIRAINGVGAGPSSNEIGAHTPQLIPTATITPVNPNTVVAGPSQMQIVFNEAATGFTTSSLSLSRSGGSNLLTGAQTLSTTDNITYTLNNLSSLDLLGGAYTLTFTAAGSGVIDSRGTSANSNASASFVVNPTAPEVTAVYISGSAWQKSVLNYLVANNLGDAQLGYRLTGGAEQLKTLPWTNINTLAVAFSRDVNIDKTSIQLIGSPSAPPPPVLNSVFFQYDSTSHVATWIFPTFLPLNKYLLSIPSTAVTSKASGATLDGEFANGASLLPSGNASAGGDFNFRFNVLPGDVDRLGTVTPAEIPDLRAHFLYFATDAGYSPYMDTLAKGRISGLDLYPVQDNQNQTILTLTDPPIPGGGSGGVLGSQNITISGGTFQNLVIAAGVTVTLAPTPPTAPTVAAASPAIATSQAASSMLTTSSLVASAATTAPIIATPTIATTAVATPAVTTTTPARVTPWSIIDSIFEELSAEHLTGIARLNRLRQLYFATFRK